MKSKRRVLLALTINKQYFIRGDGILTILDYRKELADFIKSAGVPTVAITLVNDEIPLSRVEGDNVKIGQLAAEHFLERGYRHFAWAPFLNDVMDSERHEGFARRLEKRGWKESDRVGRSAACVGKAILWSTIILRCQRQLKITV